MDNIFHCLILHLVYVNICSKELSLGFLSLLLWLMMSITGDNLHKVNNLF